MVGGVEAVEVGGFRIAFEREGHGPPLLLLHGFVGDGVGTWRYQLEMLSDEFTVVAWDAPGAGRSSAAPQSFRLSDYADCLSGFVNELKLTHPYVAGLSFGSVMALELFRRHRGLSKLVLASAYAGWAGLPRHHRRRRDQDLAARPRRNTLTGHALAGRTRPPTATGPGCPGSDQQLSRAIDTDPGSSHQPRRRRQSELAQLDPRGRRSPH
jgi:pimeloyl-ACP methyl ester carboxylesterase